MIEKSELFEVIDDYIKSLDWEKKPVSLYEPIEYFLNIKGKRLRPYLTLLACASKSNTYINALPSAVAVELFHNFTLMHDDIMDEAPLRRGMQTIHNKYNINTAILSGDALLILAYQQVAKTPSKYLEKVLNIFNTTALQICEGQQLDMDFEYLDIVSETEYLNMIGLKTSVLLAAAMQIGAIIGGATDLDAQYFYDYAFALGIAFQIQDDYLDSFGDEKIIGKKIGGDILNNKKTLLSIYARKNNNEIDAILKNNAISNETKIEQIKSIYISTNAVESLLQKRNELVDTALNSLEKIDVDKTYKSQFKELVQQLIFRDY